MFAKYLRGVNVLPKLTGRGHGQCHPEEVHGLFGENIKDQAFKLSVVSALLLVTTKCESIIVVTNVAAVSEKISGRKNVSA